MIQEGWIRYIRELNANRNLLGTVNDLGEFLFGTNRKIYLCSVRSLTRLKKADVSIACILSGNSRDVDHFIPWALYSLDLAHNFVWQEETILIPAGRFEIAEIGISTYVAYT